MLRKSPDPPKQNYPSLGTCRGIMATQDLTNSNFQESVKSYIKYYYNTEKERKCPYCPRKIDKCEMYFIFSIECENSDVW